MKRWTPDQLVETTGKHQRAAQARWFKTHFGVEVACDAMGPIMTDDAYGALVKKKCGVLETAQAGQARPVVRLVGKAA